MTEMLQIWSR